MSISFSEEEVLLTILIAIISARVGSSTFLPNFFCKVFHNFVITGLKTLSNNGVAAAPAVATTAIATLWWSDL